MEGTCLKEKCIFWGKKDEGKVCPFYRETVWVNEENNTPTILEDCAPVRSMFMQMDDHNNTIGVKILANQIRNTLDKLKADTEELMYSYSNEIKSLKRNTDHLIDKGKRDDIHTISYIRSQERS